MDATGPETEQVTNKLMDEEAEHARNATVGEVDNRTIIIGASATPSMSAIHREALDAVLRMSRPGSLTAESLVKQAKQIASYLSGTEEKPKDFWEDWTEGYNRGIQDAITRVLNSELPHRVIAELVEQLKRLTRR